MTNRESSRVVAECPLTPVPMSVQAARAFVQLTLRSWGLDALVQDAELVISELATNAVKATGTPEALPLPATAYIRVRILLLPKTVVLEVGDSDPKPPLLQEAGDDDDSGRGLLIVTMLAECWDYYPYRGGKVVWAELAIPAPAAVDASLPQRLVATELRGPRRVEVNNDPELLDRVHQALLEL